MAMKKATKERINAAYDRGYADGDSNGYARAQGEHEAARVAANVKGNARKLFSESLDAEADPE
jgi:hypothetical protein